MLDPHVAMSVVSLPVQEATPAGAATWIQQDVERAQQLRRELDILTLPKGDLAQAIVQLAKEGQYDVIIIARPSESSTYAGPPLDAEYVVRHAPCWVCLVTPTAIPQ